jgi:beta-lactamase class A
MKRRTSLAAFLLLLCSPAAAQTATLQLTAKQQLLWQKFEAKVAAIDRELDGAMGVVVTDLTTGKQLLLNADEVFPTASSIKLPLLVELYRQEQQGKGARLGDSYLMNSADLVPDSQVMGGLTHGVTKMTNRDLAVFVVAVSDNSATNVLIDRVGFDHVNAMLDSFGLRQTRLRRKMMDLAAAKQGRENVATPRELATLLEAIYRGKVLNKALTEDLLKLLETKKDSAIPRLLPEDVPVANKPGELEGVRTDSGIVFAVNRPFVISVMTSYDRDERKASEAISRIAREAYEMFRIFGESSDYGRVISAGNSH